MKYLIMFLLLGCNSNINLQDSELHNGAKKDGCVSYTRFANGHNVGDFVLCTDKGMIKFVSDIIKEINKENK